MSVRSPTPSVAELRAVTQPAELFARNSGEHWAGKLYMRRLSPYLTRPLLRTRVTPNAVTWFMMVVGLAAAARPGSVNTPAAASPTTIISQVTALGLMRVRSSGRVTYGETRRM